MKKIVLLSTLLAISGALTAQEVRTGRCIKSKCGVKGWKSRLFRSL